MKATRKSATRAITGLIICSSMITSCHTIHKGLTILPDNPSIHYEGRVSFRNPQKPIMVFPGTSIEANFTGTSLAMKAKPGSGYFMVQIDGQEAKKIHFTSNDSIITIGCGLPKGEHTARIMLAYEGYNDRPEFRGFILDKKAEMLPWIELRKLKLEFVGNSITCGYGIEASSEKERFSDSTANHYYTYAAQTARNLNAQYMVVARSGIGMYRKYNGNPKGDRDIMPRWYDYTLLYDSTEVWNAKRYTPDIVCINLGTNDLSTDGYDKRLYQRSYRSFLFHLRTLYPQAKLVMLTGTMLNGNPLKDQCEMLDELLNEMQALGDYNIYRFNMTPMDGSLGYGADWHPSRKVHDKMAIELSNYLKKLIQSD